MTWLQILAQAGVMATFVGVGIAVAAYFNGKHIKAGVSELGEMIKELGEMIKEGNRELGEMIKEIKESNNGIRDLIAQMEKNAQMRHQEVLDWFKRSDERTHH